MLINSIKKHAGSQELYRRESRLKNGQAGKITLNLRYIGWDVAFHLFRLVDSVLFFNQQ